jgi:SlyX protein
MNEADTERLQRIEAALAHVERLCDELNGVVVEQGRELARLRAQVLRVTQSVETAELERIRATNPKPPHHS